jgi:hypothetical protein
MFSAFITTHSLPPISSTFPLRTELAMTFANGISVPWLRDRARGAYRGSFGIAGLPLAAVHTPSGRLGQGRTAGWIENVTCNM